MEKIKWKYDPIKLKDGSTSKSVLYGDDCFIITTSPNRLLSTNLLSADKTTLRYHDNYTMHRYWGTLKQMKTLAQQIKDNQELFKRFIYLDAKYTMAESNLWGEEIDFKKL
jgi:hypothetical protein